MSKVHYSSKRGVTRCGKDAAAYYMVEMTQDPLQVTCQTCLRSMNGNTNDNTD